MVALTTHQAAAITGRNRSTIWRAIKAGRVSASKTATGDYLVEPVELERTFGPLQRRPDAPRPHATGRRVPASHATPVEVALLRERVAALEADKEDLRLERDRLLRMIEQQSGQLRPLSDRRGFWRRLLGRDAAP